MVATVVLDGISIEGFLTMWALMTLSDPTKTVEYIRYLMSDRDVAPNIHVTRRRSTKEYKS